MQHELLAPDEPAAVEVLRPEADSPFFLICDHAGARIPRALGTLGLSAAGLARRLAAILDACALLQTYSRLVIDCNRPLGGSGSIVAVSERTPIPGNESIDAWDRARREREVFRPYHDRIRTLLAARKAAQRASMLISVHSFTPVFLGESRRWHAGILYNRDGRLARATLAALRGDAELVVGENQPYALGDASDYAVPEYGEKQGLLHVEIEVRQDLIADERGQQSWAVRLAEALQAAAAHCVGNA